MNPIEMFFTNSITNLLNQVSSSSQPLVQLIGKTPLNLTTANTFVDDGWTAMAMIANSALVVFVIIGTIQIMYGQSVGSLQMPIGQFLGRALLTAIMINMSSILGQDLVIFNNALCEGIQANLQQFIMQINNGLAASQGQTLELSLVLAILFGFGIIRIVFQSIKRIAMINLLFVLGPLAYLLSFHPVTAPMFSFWGRTFIMTIFTQFIQFLAIGLGIQVLLAAKQPSLINTIMAAVTLNMAADIPALLSRFASTPGANTSGISTVVRTAVTAAAIMA